MTYIIVDVERVDEAGVMEDTNCREQHVVRLEREVVKVETT